jgi:hypothetical protein
MNPEFKAFVENICEGNEEEVVVAVAAPAKRTTSILGMIADFLEEIGPYYCELRPSRRVKPVTVEYCTQREVIGYHGLV